MGITEYTTPSCKGFVGILKQRFSDFVVREISMDNEVLFLRDIDGSSLQSSIFDKEELAQPSVPLSLEEAVQGTIDEIAKAYPTFFDQETVKSLRIFLTGCHSKSPDSAPTWMGLPCEDKSVRGNLHKAIRVHSADFVESTTEQVGDVWNVKLHAKHHLNSSAASNGSRGNNNNANSNRGGAAFVKRKNFQAWPPNVGDYLRFTLMKENVDTLAAVNNLNKQLHIKANNICYNGTKDKRGITVQHLTVYRKKPSDFLRINRYFGNPFMRTGDFQYVSRPCRLGALLGNRFEIVLRNVQGEEADITQACEALRQVGFINYYGLQRFGKTYAGATHKMGKAVLQSNWRQCIEAMFAAPPAEIIAASGDDMADVRRHFQAGAFELAANALHPSMYREREILLRLAKAPSDFANAFNTMGRNMRLMYVHAYQSYVWNRSVSERLRRFGLQVVEGDLVRELSKATPQLSSNNTSAIVPEGDVDNKVDSNEDDLPVEGEDETGDNSNYSFRLVTAEDIAQQKFTIYDVVLPLLGSESLLPGNNIAQIMLDLLAEDGLSMATFSTCHPCYRLKGNYRTIMQMPGAFEYQVIRYHQPDEEINVTELQGFREAKPLESNKGGKKRDVSEILPATVDEDASAVNTIAHDDSSRDIPNLKRARVNEEGASTGVVPSSTPRYLALQLKFSLGSGCYATMLLREVMKMSTETSHHAMLSHGGK